MLLFFKLGREFLIVVFMLVFLKVFVLFRYYFFDVFRRFFFRILVYGG